VAGDVEEFDPYSVLRVHGDATLAEVRAAYRRRAQLVHPDRHADAPLDVRAEAQAAMGELNAAFDVLRGRLAEPERAPSADRSPPRIRCPACGRRYADVTPGGEFTCTCGAKLRAPDGKRRYAGAQNQDVAIAAIDNLADQGLLTADEQAELARVVLLGVRLTCVDVIPELRERYDAGELEPDEYAEARRASVHADLHRDE
jgi:DnaJ domain